MPGERTMTHRLAASLVFGPALLLAALLVPATAAAAGPITSSACSTSGTVVTCDLLAKTGSVPVPGGTTSIWGFAVAPAGTASLPGPVLVARSGDSVTVNLTNQLTVTTSILFDGQPMTPDLTGVAPGATKSYTFTAGTPGTYLYEAGLLPGTQYQVAKGLYGALIVRPALSPLQANDDPASAFDDEALVILGEVDQTLNASGTPAGYDLRAYAPRYFFVNGAAYPQATPISTTSGHRLLLRYLDAGLQHHSVGLLGLRQTIVNDDGNALANPRRMVAESLAPGQGMDVVVEIPATTQPSTRYVLYDASLSLHNWTGTGVNAGIGGMLTVIDAAGAGTVGDTGPITSLVTIDPASGALSAQLTDVTPTDPTGSGVAAAEYFIDTVGAAGTGTAMAGAFPGDPITATATVAVGGLPGGNHIVYVRGRDGLGNWGAVASRPFSTVAGGPATTGATVNPASTNGTVDVLLSATADDRATGGSNIAGAEYFIDILGADGTGVPMLPSTTSAPVAALNATIPAAVVAGLPAGSHTIFIHSLDSSGSTGAWGPAATATLTVDLSGPVASAVSVNPTPNNGTLGINSTNPVVRITATLTDVSPSTVTAGELFIDSIGAPGTGSQLLPSDGAFNSAQELALGNVPLTTVVQLTNGDHTIYVRGKDSAGNWGPVASAVLSVDKLAPTTSGPTLTPPAANAQAVLVGASASDVASGNHDIVAGEFFIDSNAGNGTGTAMTPAVVAPSTTLSGTIPAATVAGLAVGTHTVTIHAKDRAGNWGPRVSVTLRIDRTPPTFSGISLAPNSIASGTASVGLTVNGASDGATGSGVAGGEFWIANSNVPNGGGTQFSGTTASIPTSSLVPGSYTVRVRIRDVAGNWSTGNQGVRTATLTVTGPVPDAIFSDGFELQTLPGTWTSASTGTTSRLNVTANAALAGAFGLQAQGNNTNYVQYNFGTAASPATAVYDARFLFRPNGNTSNGQDILSAATAGNFNTRLFRVRYRLNAGTPQVQIQLGTGNANLAWAPINGGTATNTIEVVWRAAGSGGPDAGTLRLYVNSAQVQSLTTSSTGTVGAVRLGSVTSGGNSTLEYFDGFASKRSGTPFPP